MTVWAMAKTYIRSSLQRGAPLVWVAGQARNRVCILSSRTVALDEGLCVGMRRDRQKAQTQHNCSHSNRTRQFCTKISVLPCGSSMMQHLNFSKGYKILNDPEWHWYYSCYVVDGIAERGLPLGHVIRIPGMFACARLQ